MVNTMMSQNRDKEYFFNLFILIADIYKFFYHHLVFNYFKIYLIK